MATIGEDVTGGTAGSVLFIDANVKLAQDNADFQYDAANNTLKTKDQNNANTSNFAVGTGNVTGSSSGNTAAARPATREPSRSSAAPAAMPAPAPRPAFRATCF